MLKSRSRASRKALQNSDSDSSSSSSSSDSDELNFEVPRRRGKNHKKRGEEESESESEDDEEDSRRFRLTGIRLKVKGKQRIAGSLMRDWVSVYGSFTVAVQHFPNYGLSNNASNTREAASIARALNILLQDEGFTWVKKSSAVEVLARRLYAIETAMDHRSWQVAGDLEENSNTHSKRVQDTQLRSYKHFRAAEIAMERAQKPCSQKKGGAGRGELE